MAAGMAVALNAAASFEQGMAGVARTTYDNAKSIEENTAAAETLGKALREVAKTRPVDLKTITDLAEQAGALGVASEDVATFTTTLVDLIATTNLTAASVPQLANIANVFGLSADQYRQLGSALLETGRSTAATETDILNMSKRLSGAAAVAGYTADQVLGVSAAVLSLGSRAEAGASSVQKTIGDISRAAAGLDPQKLELFATVAGTTQEKFQALAKEDPAQALAAFVTGLGKLGGGSLTATKILDSLGITEVRQVQALEALAKGTQQVGNEQTDLNAILGVSNKAYNDGTALARAAEAQYATFTNQLAILKNNINDVAISFGEIYLPVAKQAIDLTEEFVAAFQALPEPMKQVIAYGTAAAASIAFLAAGALLIGPRIVLAADAFRKLREVIGSTIAMQQALNGSLTVGEKVTLRGAFAAGFNAKANAQAAAERAKLVLIEEAHNAVLTQTIRLEQIYGQIDQANAALQQANLAKINAARAAMDAQRTGSLRIMELEGKIAQQNALIAAAAASEERRQIAANAQARLAALQVQQTAIKLEALQAAARQEAAGVGARSSASEIAARDLQIRQLLAQMQLEAARVVEAEAAAAGIAGATAEEIAARELEVRVIQQQIVMETARIAAAQEAAAGIISSEAAAIQARELEIAAMVQQAIAQEQVVVGAKAAEAQAVMSARGIGVMSGAVTGLGFAVKTALGPVGWLIAAAGVLTYLFHHYGTQAKDAADKSKEYAKAQQEIVDALRKDNYALGENTRAVVINQLVQSGAIDTARNYGISIQTLFDLMTGANTEGAQQAVADLQARMEAGDTAAGDLLDKLLMLNGGFVASVAQARNAAAANKALGGVDQAATDKANALADAENKAADALEKRAQAALSLIDTMLGVKRANQSVEAAEKAYAEALEATKNRTKAIRKAELELAQARNDVKRATLDVAKAEYNLAHARAKAQQDVKDAEADLASSQRDYADAVQNAKDKQKELSDLQAGPSADELRDATNKLARSILNLNKANVKASDAQWYLNYLMQEGASDRDIQDANAILADAKLDVAEATADQSDAQKELDKLKAGPTAEELAAAERELADAQQAVVDAAQAVIDKTEALKQARADLKNDTAYKEAQMELTAAQLALVEAQDAVLESRKNLNDVKSGKTASEDLRNAALDLESAYYDQAKANTAAWKAQEEANGHTVTARDEAIHLADELIKMGDKMGGPVGDQIKEYGRKLKEEIPPEAKTKTGMTGTKKTVADAQKLGKDVRGALAGAGEINASLKEDKPGHIDTWIDHIKTAWGSISGSVTGMLDAINDGRWLDSLGNLLNIVPSFWAMFGTLTGGDIAAKLGEKTREVIDSIGGWFVDTWNGAWDWFTSDHFGEGWNIADPMGKWLSDEAQGVIDGISTWFGDMWDQAWAWVSGSNQAFGPDWDIAGAIWGWLMDEKDRVIERVKGWFGGMWDAVWEGVKDNLFSKFDLGGVFSRWITNRAPGIIGTVVTFMTSLPGRMWTGFTTAANAAWNLLGTIRSMVTGAASGALESIKTFGGNLARNLWNGLTEKIDELFPGLRTKIQNFFGGINFGSIGTTIAKALTAPINGLIGAINAVFDTVDGKSFNIPLADKVKKLPGMDWFPGSIGFPDIPEIPTIVWNAKGGITRQAIFGAGEAGPEAIIPLERLYSMFEPMHAIAASLQAQQSALTALASQSSGVGGVQYITNEGDTYDIDVHQDADPNELIAEISFLQRGRGR